MHFIISKFMTYRITFSYLYNDMIYIYYGNNMLIWSDQHYSVEQWGDLVIVAAFN